LEVQILSSAAKQAREFKKPEAKMDWAGGGCAGAKSSRAPTGVRGKRNEASERFHLPDAIKDWVQKDLGIMGLRPYGIRNKVGVKEAKEESEYKCLDPLY
jgi:hypothetical protein